MMVGSEEHNKYVSSRGILKSCDYHSLSPQSSIRQFINYPPLNDIKDVPSPSIYVCNSAIPNFIFKTLHKINFDFVLVSGDSDMNIPYCAETTQIINYPHLIHWFCQNWVGGFHKKITTIPLGLDYHTMANEVMFWGPITSPKEQELLLISTKEKSKPFWERTPICYGNYQFSMTEDRHTAYNTISKELVYYEEMPVDRLTSWKTQSKYSFVISPHGVGLDCHRTWEALVLGCIPIVRKSKLDILYEDLPVLMVDDWKEITSDLLKTTIEIFKNKDFSYEKLTLKYWVDQINEKKLWKKV